ncbi:hypothetical protein D7D25_00540 [Proteiniphilum sp. X52]|nr:hypothetical protein D7D25_00540 [Proteiniphilum sp. X52]
MLIGKIQIIQITFPLISRHIVFALFVPKRILCIPFHLKIQCDLKASIKRTNFVRRIFIFPLFEKTGFAEWLKFKS